MTNLKTGRVYRIIFNDVETIYIGSTFCQLRQRYYNHKKNLHDKTKKHMALYEFMKKNLEKVKIILIEEIKVKNRDELRKKEQYYIELYNTKKDGYNCVNAFLTHEERLKQKRKAYYKNRSNILVRQKKYNNKNIEKKKEYKKQYYIKNKDRLLDKFKEYRKIKIVCLCGSDIRRCQFKRHLSSKKHKEFIKNMLS